MIRGKSHTGVLDNKVRSKDWNGGAEMSPTFLKKCIGKFYTYLSSPCLLLILDATPYLKTQIVVLKIYYSKLYCD